jgi:hypothetical protein
MEEEIPAASASPVREYAATIRKAARLLTRSGVLAYVQPRQAGRAG